MVSLWDHSVARVQRVQRVRPAFGRLVQRVMDCPAGDEYEVSVTDLPFCVIRYDRHSADWLATLATPYPAAPDFPPEGKIDHSTLSCRVMWHIGKHP